ncbi:hypothetical protein TNIN_30201 [Trichonephila inaurata madagascariensis]|uniref:Uncharacterized protein n=1 Tax=Trichonephila inaurata madagascariensis TaxID=2747483 RepID=A0A8X6XA98_9ARAC|nr:hypothetical protein TNIN_30201 [Trichonephila inaurata madagascariensis]
MVQSLEKVPASSSDRDLELRDPSLRALTLHQRIGQDKKILKEEMDDNMEEKQTWMASIPFFFGCPMCRPRDERGCVEALTGAQKTWGDPNLSILSAEPRVD